MLFRTVFVSKFPDCLNKIIFTNNGVYSTRYTDNVPQMYSLRNNFFH